MADEDGSDTPTLKSNNPFKEPTVLSEYHATTIDRDVLMKYPYKTINRIMDDLRFLNVFKETVREQSLLNSRPIEYSAHLLKLLATPKYREYELLTLNNQLAHAPSIEEKELEHGLVLTTIRGLVVNRTTADLHHFRIAILDQKLPFVSTYVDKHEYHVIPKALVSGDDLDALDDAAVPAYNLEDDAFFKSLNSAHLIRVSLYSRQFENDDLFPVLDQDTITARYLEALSSNPESKLLRDVIPLPIHCFQTLINVLKGPVLLPPDTPIQKINVKATLLDAKLDISFLLNSLLFSIEDDNLVPPLLAASPSLKESYIRRILELIYRGKFLKVRDQINDFDTKYSFSDNVSLVYRTLNEVDKHACVTLGKSHNSNQLPFFSNLSACTFFQDELIIKCFENTIHSDPMNKPHYIDSLRSIIQFKANSAATTKLRTYCQNLQQRGDLVGYSDYILALKCLGIELVLENVAVDDDFIINMYQASYSKDTKNYAYFNRNLKVIASVRQSDVLNKFLESELVPLDIALNTLSIEEITEDEVVITAFEFNLDEVLQANNLRVTDEVTFSYRALLSVAVNRKSHVLMNYIETKYPDIVSVPDFSPAEAYTRLKISEQTPDSELVATFQTRLATSTTKDDDIRVLRKCLRTIAQHRDSKILGSFLESGKIDSALLPAENWPAGLDNIGNTCYLNSLLQYYFCIRPLREAILAFNEVDVDYSRYPDRKIGGRRVEESEFKRSFQFVHHLEHLFTEMIHTDKRCVQPSKELAYLSFLPLSQPVTFKNEEKDEPVAEGMEQDPIVIGLELPEAMDVDLIDLTEPKLLEIGSEQMESTIEIGRQQDVTECIENVTFQIETALEPERLEADGEQYDLIKKLFYGKTKQTIVPLEGEAKERVLIERFFSLIINVSDHPKNIYDSLDNYFSEDIVNLDEGLVKKSITIEELPEILQFHVQRVMFDRERLMAYKSIEPIPFSEQIYLDRYLATDDEDIIRKRHEVFEWKSHIHELHEKKDAILRVDDESKLSIIDSLSATKKFLEARREELNVKDETISVIGDQIAALRSEIQNIHNELNVLQEKVAGQFSGYTQVGYTIFAIFIHRGEASYGHYWVYIRDPHRNIFRKYNDETVTEVPAAEVFNFAEGNTATPYYIVYVKELKLHEYVDPLRRVINKC